MKKPLTRLYVVFFSTILAGFLALGALYFHKYFLALLLIAECWFINYRFYVCPHCGARLSPRARLTKDVVCGKCQTYIATGEKVQP